MLWFLRTLPLALAVGLAVGMSAAWHKASQKIVALEAELAGAAPQLACVPSMMARAEPLPAARVMLAVATHALPQREFTRPQPAPAAPAPCRAPKAAAPAAPPLPFTYLGRMVDDGGLQIFLARGEQTVVARAGEKIGAYRVDEVTPGSVTFTHLPSKTRQALDIPGGHQ